MTEYDGVERSTATETFRAMLDERGVDWDYGITGATTTRFSVNGIDLTFMPMRDGLVCSTILTPEKVIAATLGPGTCKVEGSIDYGEFGCWQYELSCGCRIIWPDNEPPRFCPECGARVEVDA